jgi:hypothetical protein
MGIALAVAAVVIGGCSIAAIYLVIATRRGVAASLIGEITEILNSFEAHVIEKGLPNMDVSTLPLLSSSSTVIYQSHAARIGLLGSHLARVIASFYASVGVLTDELRTLAAETSESGRATRINFVKSKLQATFDVGDEALRGLRPLISRRRPISLSRA